MWNSFTRTYLKISRLRCCGTLIGNKLTTIAAPDAETVSDRHSSRKILRQVPKLEACDN